MPNVSHLSRDEIIKCLNQLDIHPSEKVDFALVYLGEKPATEWKYSAVSRQPGWPVLDHGRKRFDDAVAWAAVSGLPYETEEHTVNPAQELMKGVEGEMLRQDLAQEARHDKENRLAKLEADAADPNYSEDRLTLYLAQTPTWLDRMKTASREHDPKLYGECSGFPATAIAAYLKGPTRSPRSFGVLAPEIAVFAQYALSPEHPHLELATAERWAKAVHSADPILYQQMLDLMLPPEARS